MAVQVQKKKILYLMHILCERTDETHIMSANDLCMALQEYGISAERKGIYSDIDTLRDFGMDIIQVKGASQGYYVGNREFSMPELKLLVDAVQSSKFITKKKTRELIHKLEGHTSRGQAVQLQRQVYIHNRLKADNETIYYNVDSIHTAIIQNKQVQFQYAEWNIHKQLQLKKNGAFYIVSPWALTFNNENYYLIAYDEKADMIKHYRVDKMQALQPLQIERKGKEQFECFDLAAHMKKTFGMYGGHDEWLTLLCHNDLAGVILDRFGHEVSMIPQDENHFSVSVLVTVSRQFFGWITGIGEQIVIQKPQSVRLEYKCYLERMLQNI